MRIGDQIRESVVFFGYSDKKQKSGIRCVGTGFLLEYDGVQYLVTAKHLSHSLGRDPFLIRVNRKDGTAENLPVDDVDWTEHPDPTVDVSAVPLTIEDQHKYEADCLGVGFLFQPGEFDDLNIGVGSATFTMGLFQLLSGEKRNLTIVHTGNIAMLPRDEKIPVVDWTDPDGKRRLHVEGYLVESLSLRGLSGSPVFVHTEINVDLRNFLMRREVQAGIITASGKLLPTEEPVIHVHRDAVKLLGLWQGAWEAPPDEVLAAQTGDDVRVPVGIGVVVPLDKIIEVLEMPKLKDHRDESKKTDRSAAFSQN
jgi:hypothetical protein